MYRSDSDLTRIMKDGRTLNVSIRRCWVSSCKHSLQRQWSLLLLQHFAERIGPGDFTLTRDCDFRTIRIRIVTYTSRLRWFSRLLPLHRRTYNLHIRSDSHATVTLMGFEEICGVEPAVSVFLETVDADCDQNNSVHLVLVLVLPVASLQALTRSAGLNM